MKTKLLRIIKAEIIRRNAPAIVVLQKKKKKNNEIKKSLAPIKNVYNALLKIYGSEMNKIVLLDQGHKYAEVYEELTEAGYESKSISYIHKTKLSVFKKLYILKIVIVNLFRILKIYRYEHSKAFVEIVLLYFCYNSIFKQRFQNQKSVWIVIGDLTSVYIALSAAIHNSIHRLVYWQYSFLDFKYLPFPADIAIILNETGIELSKINNLDNVFWRKIEKPENLRLKINNQPVGVLLNVHADQKSIKVIEQLQTIIQKPLEIRKHPNSKLDLSNLSGDIKIADSAEDLDDFSRRICFGICGNTQAQAKLLMLGTPVVQVEGLDILEFDTHNYVKNKIVYGIRKLDDFSYETMVSFYKSKIYKTGLYNLIGPQGHDRKSLIGSKSFS